MDSLMPDKMAEQAEDVGIKKANRNVCFFCGDVFCLIG